MLCLSHTRHLISDIRTGVGVFCEHEVHVFHSNSVIGLHCTLSATPPHLFDGKDGAEFSNWTFLVGFTNVFGSASCLLAIFSSSTLTEGHEHLFSGKDTNIPIQKHFPELLPPKYADFFVLIASNQWVTVEIVFFWENWACERSPTCRSS